MRKLFIQFNFSQTVILTISFIGVLLLSNFLCLPVNAHPLNSVKTSGLQTSFLIAKLPTAEDTYTSLRKNIKSANEALKNMPEQLQEDLISMNAAKQAMK